MNTPLIIKALETKADRYYPPQRFADAVETLSAATAKKEIWNTDFEGVKWTVSQCVERAVETVYEPFQSVLRLTQTWDNDVASFCYLNQAAGRAKRLSKKFGGDDAKARAAQPYIALLREVATVHELVQAVKPFIKKGRKPPENPVEVDLSNTGICAICSRRQKLTGEQKMVHHGFQISDGHGYFGYRVGSCFGVGYKPYELSNEANLAYAPQLQRLKAGYEEVLTTYQSGRITALTVERRKYEGGRPKTYGETITKEGNPAEFEREMKAKIAELESIIRAVNSDISANDARIKEWTLQPLKYGTKATR